MSATFKPRTVVQAIEDAAKSTQTGYRFVDENSEAEPFFSHAGIERASARFGGALQSLGLQKGDRVALVLPDNADFPEGAPAIHATIVPRDDVDTFAMDVGDGYQLLCDGTFSVVITAPREMTVRLEVLDGDEVVEQVTSADGIPARIRLGDPDCLFSDARTLTARVSPIGSDRTAGEYVLERSGSF